MHRFAPLLCALACAALAGVSLAAPRPLATFDRVRWSPDGTLVAIEMSMFRPEVSLDRPARVDTVLFDPMAARFSCVTPRVAAFALNAARDSIIFADEYGAYVAPYPSLTSPRTIVWRGPSCDYYVREVDFARDGRYYVYSGCFSQLSPGCWEKWVVATATDRITLPELRMLQWEGETYGPPQGSSPEYVRLQKRKTGPTLMDDLEPRAAFLRVTAAQAGIRPRGKGKAAGPRLDILYGREIPGDGRWLASVRLTPPKSSRSRVFTCVYDPRTRSARVLAEDVIASYLPVSPTEVLYADTEGWLWRLTLAGDALTRTRVVPSFVPAWAHTLGDPGSVYAARVRGIEKPERADELVSALLVKGYHAWPTDDGGGKWGVSVGWFGAQAEADSVSAMLASEGYAAASVAVRPHEVRADSKGARPGRSQRVKVTTGPLAGAEAMVEVAAGEEGPQTIFFLRRKGGEARSFLNGYDDPFLP